LSFFGEILGGFLPNDVIGPEGAGGCGAGGLEGVGLEGVGLDGVGLDGVGLFLVIPK